MNISEELLSGINLESFDHNDLFAFLDRLEGQPPQEVAQIFLRTFLQSFHKLPLLNRWNIYALGGYEHGVENMSPYRETQKEVITALQIDPSSKIAIFGTGTGPLERELLEQEIDFKGATGFDISSGMLEIHKRRFGHRVAQVEQDLTTPIQASEFGFNRFTAINALETFKAQIPVFLSHLQTVLQPQSVGVIVTPREGIKTSLPFLKGHLVASDIRMSDDFWSSIIEKAEHLWDTIFNETGEIPPEKLQGDSIETYLEMYADVLGKAVLSLQNTLSPEDLRQVYVMGLMNAVPPIKLHILPRPILHGYFEEAEFSIEDTKPVNAGQSDLIVVKKV